MLRVEWPFAGPYLPPAYVRTMGGYVFTGVCLFNFWGGYPIPSLGRGYPIPGLAGGYPIPGPGGTPSQVQGGTPSQVWGGTPSQVRGGTLSQVWGGTLGSPPQTDQHREHLLCGGRYASCIHAGGLPCSFTYFYRGGDMPLLATPEMDWNNTAFCYFSDYLAPNRGFQTVPNPEPWFVMPLYLGYNYFLWSKIWRHYELMRR